MSRPSFIVSVLLLCSSLSLMDRGGSSMRSSAVAFACGPSSGDASGSSNNRAAAIGGDASESGDASASVPLLPAANPDDNLPSIMLGETISFEAIGPIILNADGTTRRISNWEDMTPQEQQATWRRIKKRNEERRIKLLQQQADEEAKAKPSDTAEEL